MMNVDIRNRVLRWELDYDCRPRPMHSSRWTRAMRVAEFVSMKLRHLARSVAVCLLQAWEWSVIPFPINLFEIHFFHRNCNCARTEPKKTKPFAFEHVPASLSVSQKLQDKRLRKEQFEQMNLKLLEEARTILPHAIFKELVESISNKGAINLWKAILEITSLPDAESIVPFLKKLGDQSDEKWFVPFMYVLDRELKKTPLYEQVNNELYRAAPFLTPKQLVDISSTEGALSHLVPYRAGAPLDSLKRVLANLEGRYPPRTEEEWLADLRTAKKYFKESAVEAVEAGFSDLRIPETFDKMSKISKVYKELQIESWLHVRIEGICFHGKEQLLTRCQLGEHLVADLPLYHRCLKEKDFVQAFEHFMYKYRFSGFKEMYAFAFLHEDANALHMRKLLKEHYKILSEDVRLQLYALHEVPDTFSLP